MVKKYTLAERVDRITTTYKNLQKFGLYKFLTDETKEGIKKFVEKGEEYHKTLELTPPLETKIPPFTISIDLVNNKKFDKKNDISVKFHKINQ